MRLPVAAAPPAAHARPLDPRAGELSDADVAALLKWVNPVYLSEDSWGAIQAKFQRDGSIQLQVGWRGAGGGLEVA